MISIPYIIKDLCKLVRWNYPVYDSCEDSCPSGE